ncbi:Tyrosine-protein kinase Src42A [Pelomyxa schiedti]|nr:Tyrosine-protein kinase Src42A [Pelomyxa schiedti]
MASRSPSSAISSSSTASTSLALPSAPPPSSSSSSMVYVNHVRSTASRSSKPSTSDVPVDVSTSATDVNGETMSSAAPTLASCLAFDCSCAASSRGVDSTSAPVAPRPMNDIEDLNDVVRLRELLRQERRIKEYLNILQQTATSLDSTMKTFISMLKRDTGCTTVGIRLADQGTGDFPYYYHEGYSTEFLRKENSLVRCIEGKKVLAQGASKYPYAFDCQCGNVILGISDPNLPWYTRKGSFMTNDLANSVAPRISEMQNTACPIRGECLREGFSSLLMSQIKVDGSAFGLIQIADKTANRLSPGVIELVEMLSDSVGGALKQTSEYTLRKRALLKLTVALSLFPPAPYKPSHTPSDFLATPLVKSVSPELSELLSNFGLSQYVALFESKKITSFDLFYRFNEKVAPIGLSSLALEKLRLKTSCFVFNQILDDVLAKEVIGRGAYGVVYRGCWQGTTSVAIKQVNKACNINQLRQEAAILNSLNHPNILQFYGITTIDGKFALVTELADGCVLPLLRTEELAVSTIMEFIRDVAEGMTYLSEHNVIHRDLAARNLLYITSSCGYNIKIADFGLSVMYKNGSSTCVPSQNEVSVRWCSLETLTQGLSTTKSDVWSFGVVVWELLTFGRHPYSDLLRNCDVYQYVLSGKRLPKPDTCPDNLWALLEKCWNADPSSRPEFEVFSVFMSKLLSGFHSTYEDDYDRRPPDPPLASPSPTHSPPTFPLAPTPRATTTPTTTPCDVPMSSATPTLPNNTGNNNSSNHLHAAPTIPSHNNNNGSNTTPPLHYSPQSTATDCAIVDANPQAPQSKLPRPNPHQQNTQSSSSS